MKTILFINVLILSLLISIQVKADNTYLYPGDIVYMVRKGDTIKNLASKFHSTPSAIIDANAINNLNQLTVGAKLLIPISKERGKEEVSKCHGAFQTGETVDVTVNWDSNTVKVNKFLLKLSGPASLVSNDNDSSNKWIATETYINQLDRPVYYMVGTPNLPYHGNYLMFMDGISNRVVNVASLFCSKSFDKPFMKRMLGKQ